MRGACPFIHLPPRFATFRTRTEGNGRHPETYKANGTGSYTGDMILADTVVAVIIGEEDSIASYIVQVAAVYRAFFGIFNYQAPPR